MRVDKLIALVRDKIGIQFMSRTIALELENAINQVCGQIWMRDPSQYDLLAKEYIATIDRSGVRPIAKYPVPILQIADAPNGLRYIYSEKEDNRRYEPILAQSLSTYHKLGMSEFTEAIAYVPYTESCEFWNLPISVESVRMYIVRPFSAFEDSEEYPLPAGAAETIVQMAIDSLKGDKIQPNIYKTAKA